jgi:hypothetical protein
MKLATAVSTLALLIIAVGSPAECQQVLLRTHQFDPLQGEPWIQPELRAAEPQAGQAGYYLVQLTGPVYEYQKAGLRSEGAELWDYIPEYGFIARMTPEAALAVRSLEFVRWVGLYHPAYKIDPDIGTHTFKTPARVSDPWLWIVAMVHRSDDAEGAGEAIAGLGAEVLDVVREGAKRVIARTPGDLLEDIARLLPILYVYEQDEFFVHNNTTRWVIQTNQSGNTHCWNCGLHGEGQLITVMDSGVDYQSCFFRDSSNPIGSSHRKIHHYGTWGGNAYDGCDSGHGSHVAGTVAGKWAYDNPDQSQYNGVAYEARIMVQDIGVDDAFACAFGSVSPPSGLTGAFQDAYNRGARLHTNSWGGSSNQYDAYAQDIDEFMWNNTDFLVCFAMGNAGPGSGTIGYPATAKDCISAGGTQQANTQDNMYNSSSRGPTYDDRQKPTVCAPADGANGGPPDIWSVDNDPSSSPTCAVVGSGWNGTSMATPAVCASGALIRQYFVDGYWPTGVAIPGNSVTPSGALIKAMLVASGERMTGSGISAYPDDNQGWGRVLLDKALYFNGDDVGLDFVDHAGISTGNTYSTQFYLGTKPARFVLVWTDYYASTGANPAIVNDLNLRVTDPAGRAQYWGNVFSSGQSVPGGSPDNVNVVEVVHVENPASPGLWTVEVIGANVPQGPQPFAVSITGNGLNIPVCLESFQGSFSEDMGGVLLEWTTASERENLGFFVLRSEALGGEYKRTSEVIIEGRGTTALPTSYSYVDDLSEAGTYYYKLLQVDNDGTTNTHGPITVSVGAPTPERFAIGPAVPNPFKGTVTVSYGVPRESVVRLAIYDVRGSLIDVLHEGEQQPAMHRIVWDGQDSFGRRVKPGKYVCRLEADDYVGTVPLVMVE